MKHSQTRLLWQKPLKKLDSKGEWLIRVTVLDQSEILLMFISTHTAIDSTFLCKDLSWNDTSCLKTMWACVFLCKCHSNSVELLTKSRRFLELAEDLQPLGKVWSLQSHRLQNRLYKVKSKVFCVTVRKIIYNSETVHTKRIFNIQVQ